MKNENKSIKTFFTRLCQKKAIQLEKSQAINLSLWETVWLFIFFNYASKERWCCNK